MDKKDTVVIILIVVIALVLASLAIPVIQKTPQAAAGQNPAPAPGSQPGQQVPQPAGQEEIKQLKTAISFVNLGLIISLFVIYAGLYRKMRSSFTLGLMAVIFALGMYAVTSNPLIVGLLGGRAEYISMFQIVPDLCAMAALLLLVRISLE
jgi:tellurite resistance protein TehA-like permease